MAANQTLALPSSLSPSATSGSSSSDEDDVPLAQRLGNLASPVPAGDEGGSSRKRRIVLESDSELGAESSMTNDSDFEGRDIDEEDDEEDDDFEASEGHEEAENNDGSDDSDNDQSLDQRRRALSKVDDKSNKKTKSVKERKPRKKKSKKEGKRKKQETSRPRKKAKKEDLRLGGSEVYSANNYESMGQIAPLKPDKGSHKWWDLDPLPEGQKWQTLVHNGVLFPPAYEPHGIKMLYEGEIVDLTTEQEEVATFYAAMLETDFVKNSKFNDNFFADWRNVLGSSHKIQRLDKCDFRPIFSYLQARKESKKEEAKLPEVKAAKKAEREATAQTFGFALVDLCLEKVGNYTVEPPGLFRGRGDHPKTGKLKRRVQPEDIIINIGKGEKIPKCPMPGRNWGGIVHNCYVTWLAYWKENINGGSKYVWLHSSSRFKGQSDIDKYAKARKLKDYIDRIREAYMKQLSSTDKMTRQRATALWIIDRLALRVGNTKDTDEEADTVGCCSLRVEHLSFPSENRTLFDFLGKDSMRYYNEVELHPTVFRNLRDFCTDKPMDAEVFDALTVAGLNAHLNDLMPGLSAKVFRTYNASVTLERELFKGEEAEVLRAGTVDDKVYFYNNANREVAILCNHQKTVSKNFGEQMDRIEERLKKTKEKYDGLRRCLSIAEGRVQPKANEELATKIKDKQRLKEMVARADAAVKKIELSMRLKEDLKTVALGTSKINYMDPRISVAWCKRHSVPIEKIFNRSLLVKFVGWIACPLSWLSMTNIFIQPWAMEVSTTWAF